MEEKKHLRDALSFAHENIASLKKDVERHLGVIGDFVSRPVVYLVTTSKLQVIGSYKEYEDADKTAREHLEMMGEFCIIHTVIGRQKLDLQVCFTELEIGK